MYLVQCRHATRVCPLRLWAELQVRQPHSQEQEDDWRIVRLEMTGFPRRGTSSVLLGLNMQDLRKDPWRVGGEMIAASLHLRFWATMSLKNYQVTEVNKPAYAAVRQAGQTIRKKDCHVDFWRASFVSFAPIRYWTSVPDCDGLPFWIISLKMRAKRCLLVCG